MARVEAFQGDGVNSEAPAASRAASQQCTTPSQAHSCFKVCTKQSRTEFLMGRAIIFGQIAHLWLEHTYVWLNQAFGRCGPIIGRLHPTEIHPFEETTEPWAVSSFGQGKPRLFRQRKLHKRIHRCLWQRVRQLANCFCLECTPFVKFFSRIYKPKYDVVDSFMW